VMEIFKATDTNSAPTAEKRLRRLNHERIPRNLRRL
jgi:hypothetical protein